MKRHMSLTKFLLQVSLSCCGIQDSPIVSHSLKLLKLWNDRGLLFSSVRSLTTKTYIPQLTMVNEWLISSSRFLLRFCAATRLARMELQP